jgi:hypothetical protein
VARLGQWLNDQRAPDDVAFILDYGIDDKRALRELFDLVTADPVLRRELRVKSLDFEQVKDSPGLQAADRHAYEGFKAVRDWDLDIDNRQRRARKSACNLLLPFGKDGTVDGRVDEECLREYLQRLHGN